MISLVTFLEVCLEAEVREPAEIVRDSLDFPEIAFMMVFMKVALEEEDLPRKVPMLRQKSP